MSDSDTNLEGSFLDYNSSVDYDSNAPYNSTAITTGIVSIKFVNENGFMHYVDKVYLGNKEVDISNILYSD